MKRETNSHVREGRVLVRKQCQQLGRLERGKTVCITHTHAHTRGDPVLHPGLLSVNISHILAISPSLKR
ncbi:hypothetical protein LZ32DRAFT_315948 [Colletotrichum eremochloae]|nr:hypothetical protein LZ32DRAFT_315948 [Colletotrichum eremochloae]